MRTYSPDSRVECATAEPLRIEAFVAGAGFAPHRHDTYTLAWTLKGVQSFCYRRTQRHSLPGGLVVLHPDELHDGRAGTDEGLLYRSIYVEPALIQDVLGGRSLPFLESGTSTDPRLMRALRPLLEEYQRPLDRLELQDALYELSVALCEVCGNPRRLPRADFGSAETARQYLLEHWDQPLGLDTLERIAQRDRWKLSRDFRALFGTSPYRYLSMRRLEKARELMLEGCSLADVAAACRFSDQSHFTRQFRKAFGITPGQWTACVRPGAARTIVL